MNRKQIMTLALLGLLTVGIEQTRAQEAPKARERKEIIIREKEGKGEKMTIIVDGDKVTINGKPLEEYGGGNVIIRKKNIEGGSLPYAYSMPRIPRAPIAPLHPEIAEGWNFSFDEFDSPAIAGPQGARLGVITDEDAKGAKITEVMKESAAAKAGLKEGDIITAVDGKKVDGPESLSEIISSKKPEQESSITYLRDKKSKTMKVKLGKGSAGFPRVFQFEAPDMENVLIDRYRAPLMERELAEQFRELNDLNGLKEKQFRELENEFRSQDMEKFRWDMERGFPGGRPKLGLRIEDTEEATGVKVIDVEAGSAAEKAGFKKDDIITHINNKKIVNTDQARDLIRENREKPSYPVTVQRNGQPYNMEVKTPRDLKKANL
jgi:serine protease Do